MCGTFAAAYGVGAPLTENQNSYLLHAAARANWGNLARDWTARTADPFPVFTTLATPLLHSATLVALGGAQLFAIAVYAWALVGIVRATFEWRDTDPALATAGFALLACHSRLLASASMRTTGVDARALLVDGIAGQYLLGRVLQPSVAGIFLLVSIYAFLRGRPIAAVVCSSLAATMHATYLLSAALLTVSYVAISAGRGSHGRALAIAGASLALVAPVAVYAATTFRPTDAETFQRAAHILADDRIAQQARIATWFGGAAIFRLAVGAGALWLVRRRPIFWLLWPAFVVGVVASLLLAVFPNPIFELQFPWRVSVWIVPISMALLAGSVIEWARRRRGLAVERLRRPALVVASLVVAYGVAGSVREARAVDRRPDAPLLGFVASAASMGDVYVIPPDMEDFRLRTRTPIVVDAKTHPFRDVEVVEWSDRLQRSRAFYGEANDVVRCDRLRELAQRDGATHVVVTVAHPIACLGVDRVYADGAFLVLHITW